MPIYIKEGGTWKATAGETNTDCQYHILTMCVLIPNGGNAIFNVAGNNPENDKANNLEMQRHDAGTGHSKFLLEIDCGYVPRLVLPFYWAGVTDTDNGGNYYSMDYINPILLASSCADQNNDAGHDRYMRFDVHRRQNESGVAPGYLMEIVTPSYGTFKWFFKVVALK